MVCSQQQSCGLVSAFHFLPTLLAFKFLLKVESLIHRQKKVVSCIQDVSHKAGSICLQAAKRFPASPPAFKT